MLVILCLLTALVRGSVIELTDENFEHDTQASSGATTGDWFVSFYAPWCGHCKRLNPIWEHLGNELQGDINVAKLDATIHTKTRRRFHIQGFPTIKLFHHGLVYDYEGPRTIQAMKAFILEGWKEAEGQEVPPPLSFWGIIVDEFVAAIEDVKGLVGDRPEAAGVLLAFGIFAGVIISLVFFICCLEKKRHKITENRNRYVYSGAPTSDPDLDALTSNSQSVPSQTAEARNRKKGKAPK